VTFQLPEPGQVVAKTGTGYPVYLMLNLSVELGFIVCLLPALHAHLPCTTLLNSEECALSEKKKKKCEFNVDQNPIDQNPTRSQQHHSTERPRLACKCAVCSDAYPRRPNDPVAYLECAKEGGPGGLGDGSPPVASRGKAPVES